MPVVACASQPKAFTTPERAKSHTVCQALGFALPPIGANARLAGEPCAIGADHIAFLVEEPGLGKGTMGGLHLNLFSRDGRWNEVPVVLRAGATACPIDLALMPSGLAVVAWTDALLVPLTFTGTVASINALGVESPGCASGRYGCQRAGRPIVLGFSPQGECPQ